MGGMGAPLSEHFLPPFGDNGCRVRDSMGITAGGGTLLVDARQGGLSRSALPAL
jgi:hypothetical protein